MGSMNQLQSQLHNALMTETGSIFKSPEGRTFGWGKTVGNGIEGWAPGAQFVHTDGSAGSLSYVNEGTKTTASFVLMSNQPIVLADGETILLGTGSDVKVVWDGTSFNVAPATGMWANCPIIGYADGHTKAFEFFDDFHEFTVGAVDGRWTLTTTNGAAALGSAEATNTPGLGGYVTLTSGGTTAEDTANIKLCSAATGASFRLADGGKKLWYEARFMVGSVTDCSFYIGLFNQDVTELMADNTGAEAVSDGIYFRTINGTPTEIDFAHNLNGTEAEVQGNAATLATNTIVTVGFYFDGTTLTPYINGTAKTPVLAAATNFPVDQGLTPAFGVKQGGATAIKLHIDYIKCVQLR